MKIFIKQNIPFDASKFPINYSWIILIAGILGVIMSIPGQTMGVSVFNDYLIGALKVSRFELSNAYMIGTLLSASIIAKVGKLYDIYGGRIIAMFSVLVMGTTLVLISFSDLIANSISVNILSAESKYVSLATITVCFFLVRFSGQGVLTMVSRNMIMKWFVENRGFANALSGVAVSFGFSVAPGILNGMTENMGWRSTLWQLALVAAGFIVFAFIVFRDNPENCNCKPDGGIRFKSKNKPPSLPDRDYTLKEARRTYAFWIFNLTGALFALYYTAITFHIADIFAKVSMERVTAFSIFVPSAFVSLAFHFGGSWLSDYIKLKYLLFIELAAISLSAIALINLGNGKEFFYLLIVANGIYTGLNGVIISVVWPRFFGLKHLGAISGFAMSWLIAGSAIGPAIFGASVKFTLSYTPALYLMLIIAVVLFMLSFKANNINQQQSK